MSYKIPQDQLGILIGDEFFGHSIDGPDIYSVSLSDSIMPLQAGKMFKVKFDNANTISAVTLDVFGVGGPINVTKNGSLPLLANDIMDGEILLLVYDGVNYQIIAKTLSVAGPPDGTYISEPLIWDGSAWVPGGVNTLLPPGVADGDILQWNGTNWVSTSLSTVSFAGWGKVFFYAAATVVAAHRVIYYIDAQLLAHLTLDINLPLSPVEGFEIKVVLYDNSNNRTIRINAQSPNLIYKHSGGDTASYTLGNTNQKPVHLVFAQNIVGGNWIEIMV